MAQRISDAVNELLNLALPIAEEQQLPYFIGWAKMLAGWARTYHAGAPDWETMRQGLEMFPTSGTGLGFTICSGVYAGAQYNTGRYDGAMRTLDTALEHARKSQEPYIVPELLRIKGLTQIARKQTREGLLTLQQALQKAHDIDAKFWKLHIETNIAQCHLQILTSVRSDRDCSGVPRTDSLQLPDVPTFCGPLCHASLPSHLR